MKYVIVAIVVGAAVASIASAGLEPASSAPSADAFRQQLVKERTMGQRLRRELRRARHQVRRLGQVVRAGGVNAPTDHLAKIAACESGGRPDAISPGGTYRGKYQFDLQTWRGVGGTGDPAAAPEAEQDYRAYLLYQRRGAQPWPVCGS